jgi:hypothetical protein
MRFKKVVRKAPTQEKRYFLAKNPYLQAKQVKI